MLKNFFRKNLKYSVLFVGLFLFAGIAFAGGMKYTEKPSFCTACHVMNPMFESWEVSDHKAVASCNDCHAPSNKSSKYVFKATTGMGHLYNNLKGEHENIDATAKSKDLIQQNCVRCHQELIIDTHMGGGKYCIECHRNTPHGRLEKY